MFGSFSIADEKKMGKDFELYVLAAMPVIDDPVVVRYATELNSRLARVLPPMPWDVNLRILRNNGLNAFAGPAGNIFIYSGLILSVEHESDICGILAHEMAHVTQRHLAKRIKDARNIGAATLVGTLAAAALGGGKTQQAAMVGTLAAGQSAMLSYSRDDEREADHIGFQYLLEAGYNPTGMVRGFKVLLRNQYEKGGAVPTYLSTHPGLNERIGYIEDRIGRQPEDYLKRPEPDSQFKRVQMLLRCRYASEDTALRWLEKHWNPKDCLMLMGKAIALGRLKKNAQAQPLFEEALSCAPNDPLILREAGRFYFESGQQTLASRNLVKSMLLDRNDLMTQFFYARLLESQGDQKSAIVYLRKIVEELPRDREIRYYLGRYLGESGDRFGGYLQYAYSALFSGNKAQALNRLKSAEQLAKTKTQEEEIEQFRKTMDEYKDLLK